MFPKFFQLAGLFAAAGLAPLPLAAQDQPGAGNAIGRILAGESYAHTQLTEAGGECVLEVNGAPVTKSGAAVLVEPGDQIRLRISMKAESTAGRAGLSPSASGTFQQVHLDNVLWQGEPGDFFTAADNGEALWSAGDAKGKVSYVSGSVASTTIAGSDTTTAPLRECRAGVLLISGAAFDSKKDGTLLGQNIGIYPNEKGTKAPQIVQDNAALYEPPATFYRVDQRTAKAPILPYMTLGELEPPVFPESGGERYVAISPRLLKFMAAFGENVAAAGLDPHSIVVLRSFVSPNERQRLEQRGVSLAEFTRFQYGDAVALVYAPGATNPAAAKMTDITNDGIVDLQDLEKFSAIAKQTMDELQNFGGLGLVAKYEGPGAAVDAPYVHVDLRGWYVAFREGF